MTYYSYDPAGEFRFHDTAEAAKAAFEESLEYEKDRVSEGSTDDAIMDISWGQVSQSLVFHDHAPDAEEKKQLPDADFIRAISAMDHDPRQ